MQLEDQIKESILTLEQQLLESHPMMPQLLAKIHRELASNPQVIQSLTDEEISTICKGLSSFTQTAITTTKAKAKRPSKASLKGISIADLL